MSTESERVTETIGPEVTLAEEVPMVRQERWEELRRLWQQERIPVAQLARRFELAEPVNRNETVGSRV